MKTNRITNGLNYIYGKCVQHDTGILTGLGITGMVIGTIMAVKVTPKAIKLLDEKKKEKGVEKLEPIETIKTVAKCYIPIVIMESVSIACLVGSTVTNNKRNAALALAYGISENAFREYQDKVIETIGERKENAIHDEIAKDKLSKVPINQSEIISTGNGNTLCYDPITGRTFRSDYEFIRKSINDLNQWMLTDTTVNLNDFYYLLGIDECDAGKILGWNVNGGNIELRLSSQLASNGEPCIVIGFKTPPYYYYESRY